MGIRFISGKYNASNLRIMWERDNPVHLSSELHLTEYSLIDFWTNESVVRGDIVNMRLGGGRCNVVIIYVVFFAY